MTSIGGFNRPGFGALPIANNAQAEIRERAKMTHLNPASQSTDQVSIGVHFAAAGNPQRSEAPSVAKTQANAKKLFESPEFRILAAALAALDPFGEDKSADKNNPVEDTLAAVDPFGGDT